MFANRICHRIPVCSAFILLGLLLMFVQKSSAQGKGATPTYSQSQLPDKGVAGPVTTVPHSFGDEAFVRTVLERDAGDLQLGTLAQQKSQSDDVKQLAEQIVAARKNLDVQFLPIARSFEVSQAKGPSKKDKQVIAKLDGLSGSQFDEEFLKTLVRIHHQDIKDFGVEAQTAQDARVQSLAQQDGNDLSRQLQSIQQVAQAHNLVIDDKK
jgi:putative membrane protein